MAFHTVIGPCPLLRPLELGSSFPPATTPLVGGAKHQAEPKQRCKITTLSVGIVFCLLAQ